MTLFEMLPSLRHAAMPRMDRAMWPLTTHVDRLGRLCVGGMALTEVADEFGTPTYVIDEADFRHRIRRFCAALPHARVVYAGKALLTTAIAQWVAEEGTVVVEPGRAISARAGITLYRVLWVQAQPGGRAIVVVDGGSSDNPRVAPCDARTTIALANRRSMTATQPMTVVGRQGDSGDEIARDVLLPDDLHADDLLAVACTGAYHHSMASTYPMVGRPPLVAVRDGSSYELVRRETIADLLSRDLSRDPALNKRPPMQRESTESSCEALPCGEWPAFSDGVTSVVEL